MQNANKKLLHLSHFSKVAKCSQIHLKKTKSGAFCGKKITSMLQIFHEDPKESYQFVENGLYSCT